MVVLSETNAVPSSSKLTNGHATFLPPSAALNHLKNYTQSDGLSLKEIMDARKHGGLTCTFFSFLRLLSVNEKTYR